jgi:hypothetical protein
MTRLEHEDAIIAILKTAMPAGTAVAPLPMGLGDRKALDVRGSAVWVVYAGGKPRPGQDVKTMMHLETWVWSCLVLTKEYRSAKAGAVTALGLLETVNAALSGAKVDAARTLTRLGDQILRLPEGCGLMGYETQFSINVFAPRGA